MAPFVEDGRRNVTMPHLKRIVITGSESTGKTTLARDLAAHLDSLWVGEQSRAYASRFGRELTADDVSPIASEQIAAEDAAQVEAERRGHDTLILDTDLVSTVVYARHYYVACPAWIEAEARARLADLYLLCDIDLPWLPDGIRDRPRAREQLQAEFRATLAEFGARVCPVRGADENRLRAAIACLAVQ